MTIDKSKKVAGFVLSELDEAPVKELAQLSRKAAADGAVLIQNKNDVLPFKNGEKVAVFGRIQTTYYKSGTGSGGMVNVEYATNIIDSLRQSGKVEINERLAAVYEEWIKHNPFDVGKGWAQEPWCQKEMPLDEKTVAEAAEQSDTALVIIGRTAGEDKDNFAGEGSYLLTANERHMLEKVCRNFEKVCVVINSGSIIDMNFLDDYDIDSVLCVWQGGQEGGNAAADLLCGDVTPSGKLSDTIAYRIEDYPSYGNFGAVAENRYAEDIYVGYRYFETVAPDRVRYPFGFGLSYTEFDVSVDGVSVKSSGECICKDVISVDVTVKNIGKYSGKEVVQIYYGAPQGVLGKPKKQLAAYKKTALLESGASEKLTIEFPVGDMASYDDGGATGNKSCYVLEGGDYVIYVGIDVKSAENKYVYSLDKTVVTKRLSEALAPVCGFRRMRPQKQEDGSFAMTYEPVPTKTVDLDRRIAENRPADIEYTGDRGIKLLDVYDGKHTMEEFIAQLSDFDLACIARGEGMCSPKVTPGTGSAFGGVTDSLIDFGIPIACATDGPSGIRMDSGAKATSMPNGTLLACTWDDDLVEELYTLEGVEMYAYKIDALLGPGMNIHRNPLNGRNFEYFSEDPYLTGKMAAAITRGIKKVGPTSTIKHFAANNQEKSRDFADAVMSERALREIYLKGFEIAVKEGGATSLMTSYGPVNGWWSMSNYDLCTTILRGEWGYDGFVMSDWWAKANVEGEDGRSGNLKSMIRAQNDVFMVCQDSATNNDDIIEGLKEGFITRGELQRSAMNVCRYIMQAPVFERYVANGCVVKRVGSVDDSGAAAFAEFVSPVSDAEYAFTAEGDGEYYFDLTISSDSDSLAQTILSLKVDGNDTATLAVNGTGGKAVSHKVKRELESGEHKLTISFGDFANVEKVVIKK